MPKKRFTSQFSKPPSSVHSSLNSSATAGKSSNHEGPKTVNELINSSRKQAAPKTGPAPTLPAHTLPPQIRQLLSQPELPNPTPRNRLRRRVDINGRPLPAGPPPPRSWLENSRFAPAWMRDRNDERPYPVDLYHLPGLKRSDGRNLQDMCLRQMAKNWNFIKEYEVHNLSQMPTRLRMQLLSYVAIAGPEEGISLKNLKDLLMVPDNEADEVEGLSPLDELTVTPAAREESLPDDWDTFSGTSSNSNKSHNDDFFRLDLSGSVGYSIGLKQLTTLLEPSPSMSATIPHLTHLSMSYPSPNVSWRSFLALSKHIPTLTHLSLAYWPTPTMTPNARTAVMSSRYGKDIQYGGTGVYSHTLDDNFREAADVLRRLAARLYALEYLDLTGCSSWFPALRWTLANVTTPQDHNLQIDSDSSSSSQPKRLTVEGIDWRTTWLRLSTLKLYTDITLTDASPYPVVNAFAAGVQRAKGVQHFLAWWMKRCGRSKRGCWVDVQRDDLAVYDSFYGSKSEADLPKRRALDNAKMFGREEHEMAKLEKIVSEWEAELQADAEAEAEDDAEAVWASIVGTS